MFSGEHRTSLIVRVSAYYCCCACLLFWQRLGLEAYLAGAEEQAVTDVKNVQEKRKVMIQSAGLNLSCCYKACLPVPADASEDSTAAPAPPRHRALFLHISSSPLHALVLHAVVQFKRFGFGRVSLRLTDLSRLLFRLVVLLLFICEDLRQHPGDRKLQTRTRALASSGIAFVVRKASSATSADTVPLLLFAEVHAPGILSCLVMNDTSSLCLYLPGREAPSPPLPPALPLLRCPFFFQRKRRPKQSKEEEEEAAREQMELLEALRSP